jgi:putative DNA primase/helicase
MNLIDVERWVELLHGSTDAVLNWRAIHDSDKSRSPKSLRGSLQDVADELRELNSQGYAIFAPVNTVDGRSNAESAVSAITALFVDDDAGAVDYLPKIDPTMVVETSSNKKHIYWITDEVTVEEFASWQKHLAELHGTDPAVSNPNRLMRVPGFWHCKGEPYRVQLYDNDDPVLYDRDDFIGAWGEPVEEPTKTPDIVPEGRFQGVVWTDDQRKRAQLHLNYHIEVIREHANEMAVMTDVEKAAYCSAEGFAGRNDLLQKQAWQARWLAFSNLLDHADVYGALVEVANEVDPERGSEPIDSAFAAPRDKCESFERWLANLSLTPLPDAKETTIVEETFRRLTGREDWENYVVYDDSQHHIYDTSKGVWYPLSQTRLQAKINNLEGSVYSGPKGEEKELVLRSNAVSSAGKKACQMDLIFDSEFLSSLGVGVVCNGQAVIHRRKQVVIEPVTPKHRLLHTLSFDPTGSAEPVEFLRILNRCFEGDEDKDDKIRVIQEWYGSAILGAGPQYQTAMVFIGPGRNGKSTVMDILTKLLFADKSVVSVPPSSWGKEYSLDTINGALLNVVSELPVKDLLANDAIKAVISGDPVLARAPYGRPYKYRPQASHIFACNELPPVTDYSKGFWRRFVIVGFNQDMKRYGQTIEELVMLCRGETGDLFRWLLDGARALFARGKFIHPKSSHDIKGEWCRESDSVSEWLYDYTEQSEELMSVGDLYEHYRDNIEAAGRKAVSKIRFGRRLSTLGVKSGRTKESRGYYVKI